MSDEQVPQYVPFRIGNYRFETLDCDLEKYPGSLLQQRATEHGYPNKGAGYVLVREHAVFNSEGITLTKAIYEAEDGKLDPELLCEQLAKNTPGQVYHTLSKLLRHLKHNSTALSSTVQDWLPPTDQLPLLYAAVKRLHAYPAAETAVKPMLHSKSSSSAAGGRSSSSDSPARDGSSSGGNGANSSSGSRSSSCSNAACQLADELCSNTFDVYRISVHKHPDCFACSGGYSSSGFHSSSVVVEKVQGFAWPPGCDPAAYACSSGSSGSSDAGSPDMNNMNNSSGNSSSSTVSYQALPAGVQGSSRDSHAQGGAWMAISNSTMMGYVIESELLGEFKRVFGESDTPLMKLVNCCAPAAVGGAADSLWVISYGKHDE